MAGRDLSHRLALALGGRTISVEERQIIDTAAARVEEWGDLPKPVQSLIEEIESRPGWLVEG